jgi:hypothetical protein
VGETSGTDSLRSMSGLAENFIEPNIIAEENLSIDFIKI